MMRMVTVFCLSFIFAVQLFGQVAVDELQVNDQGVVFENYNGPYSYRESVFEINAIGRQLSDGLKSSQDNRAAYHLKYSIQHCRDAAEAGKYDADIFSIDQDAQVEHIRNIRAIIGSFLINYYGYSRKDATTLAYFITIYNAVYRGNLTYFQSKYKSVVTVNINQENAGLSTRYSEWAGKTKIIIPITGDAAKGNLSALNTTELGNKQVVENLQTTDKRGVKERGDLVNLKEKEITQQQKALDTATKELDKQRNEVIKQESALKEKQQNAADQAKELAQKEAEIAQKKRDAAILTSESDKNKAQKEIAKEESQLAKDKTALDKTAAEIAAEQEALTNQKAEIADKGATLNEQQQAIDAKQNEVAADKQELAKDTAIVQLGSDPEKAKEEIGQKAETLAQKEQALAAKEEKLKTLETTVKEGKSDPKMMGGNFYYLKVKEYLDGGHYNNEVYIIDAASGKILVKSPFNDICGREYTVVPEGVIVVGHKGKHEAGHFLTLLDPDTLALKVMGSDNIFFRSFVEVNDGAIFAVIKDNNDFYLGKFDFNMALTARSDAKVFSDTFISFYGNNLYINSDSRDILVLDRNSLRTVDTVKP